MSFAHEAIAALPVSPGQADHDLIRALLTRRVAYALASSESAQNFVAVDPASGILPLYLIQNNIIFQYDSTDSTTAHDGVTCLVTSDSKRYKSASVAFPFAVLDKDTTAQPVSPAPSIGDAYLIPAAATGTDWSGKDDKIGIYTARGWVFATASVGQWLYVRDETAFYHLNASGDWTAGVGSVLFSAGTIPITAIIGAKASFVVKVENQTTNAPPSSPTAPVAYIIGSSPTGSWSGNAGKLAMCLVDGTFTIITADTGDQVYDKSANIVVQWSGSAWISVVGVLVGSKLISGNTGTITTPSITTATYNFSAGTAPVAGAPRKTVDAMTYTAKKAGNRLRFTWTASVITSAAVDTTTTQGAMALYLDGDSSAFDWQALPAVPSIDPMSGGGLAQSVVFIFETTAPDTSSHTYTPCWHPSRDGSNAYNLSSVLRYRFSVDEYQQ